MGTLTDITWAPLLPVPLVALAGLLMVGLLVFGLVRGMPGTPWRAVAVAVTLLAVLNPSLVEEHREGLADLAVVLVDRSASMTLGDRPALTDSAVGDLGERLARLDNLEVRVVEALPEAVDGPADSGTRLMGALTRALADVPGESVSAVIMVTDGAVHDVPDSLAGLRWSAPLHVLVSGRSSAFDRRLEIIEAPRYGVVDEALPIVFQVFDHTAVGTPVLVTVTTPDGATISRRVTVGERHEVRVALSHAGLSVVRLEVEENPGEITTVNNQAVLPINGVREDLKVLLVSGEAHTGERIWRNTLKSDPAVELVHFTILRPPEKQDSTPIRELALIAFPVRELFEGQIGNFDLIIFDRYRKRGVIPEIHLQNIADYVLDGGAMMVAAGPDFATALGLHATVLGELMPARPTGTVHVEPFRPGATAAGRRHPVTATLAGIGEDVPSWGRWFRHVETTVATGDVLLDGAGDAPLLVISRAGEGRVAQLLSDHLWLWSRGYDGGGPGTELLRRVAHWLMQEPDLEENALTATEKNGHITVVRRSMEDDDAEVVVTAPSGATTTLDLETLSPGRARGDFVAIETGLHHISDGDMATWIGVGSHNPLEWRDPRPTSAHLEHLVEESGGHLSWIAHDPLPAVRRVTAGHDMSGPGWIGLVDHNRHVVLGIDLLALMPAWFVLLAFIAGLAAAWRAEGR